MGNLIRDESKKPTKKDMVRACAEAVMNHCGSIKVVNPSPPALDNSGEREPTAEVQSNG